MINFTLKNLLSLAGLNGRLSILVYHRVTNAVAFDQEMSWLAAYFKTITLHEAVQKLHQNKLHSRTACITFDDGYADNAEVALPILQKHGLSATFFVSTGFLDGGRMWNDTVIELVHQALGPILDLSKMGLGRFEIGTTSQRQQAINALLENLKYLPLEARQLKVGEMCSYIPATLSNNLMMTSEQVKKLYDAGMGIGGHTVNHPILARMEETIARAEIANGKEELESIIRAPVKFFAYPNGKPGQDYLSGHTEMIRNLGFEAAVTTSHGAAKNSSDLYQLPRFTPWDQNQVRYMLRMAQNMLRKPETI